MAKVRFSHLDDFVLKDDGKVGIGTSLPSARVEVIGTVRAANIKSSSGITTVTSIDGYMNQDMEYSDGVDINTGDSGTLSGEIVVGSALTMSVGTGATTGQGTIESMKVSNTFNPPIGGTNDRPTAPKPGSLFYNKDFKTIEYWDGNFWRQVDNTTAAGRAAIMGGNRNPSSVATSAVGSFSIVSGGKETIFGDMNSNGANACTGLGNRIRGIVVRGSGSTPAAIEYLTMASIGDTITFGDLNTAAYRTGGASSSSTRGLIFGGRGAPGNPHNEIQYIQLMTLGNALDFGDTKVNQRGQGCNIGSPIRGFCVANAPYSAGIEFVTISSKGNSLDFGDNIYGGAYQAGCSNSVRGVIGGGYQYPGSFTANQKSYITMASEGNAIEFGDLTNAQGDGLGYAYAAATSVRGVIMGGMDDSSSPLPSRSTVDAFNFASKGEVTVIGDLSEGKRDGACNSDSHGGLGGF